MNRSIAALVLCTVAWALAGCADPEASTPVPAKVAAVAAPSSGPFVLTSTGTSLQNPANLSVPGATGRTIVPGNNSTISGDALATWQVQTGTP
jgi:hypothetical protein